jgi:AmiR/NasT family two-component response regulator
MGRLGLTEDQAFERLRAELERSDRKLRDVAEDVIFTGDIN